MDEGAKFYESQVNVSALQTVSDIANATSGEDEDIVQAVGMTLGIPATTIISQQLKD
jgi:hypothetical protein